jgi:hypothetical protein
MTSQLIGLRHAGRLKYGSTCPVALQTHHVSARATTHQDNQEDNDVLNDDEIVSYLYSWQARRSHLQ